MGAGRVAYARGWRIGTRSARADKGRPDRTGAVAALARTTRSADNDRMDIILNGQARSVSGPLSIQSLLEAEGLAERRVAVEVNGDIVPRSRHAEHLVDAGDRVEIVHALGGG